jgi:hypothetical protein
MTVNESGSIGSISRTFAEEAEKAFPAFYAKVGQRPTQWIAKAPKVKESRVEAIAGVVPDAEDICWDRGEAMLLMGLDHFFMALVLAYECDHLFQCGQLSFQQVLSVRARIDRAD